MTMLRTSQCDAFSVTVHYMFNTTISYHVNQLNLTFDCYIFIFIASWNNSVMYFIKKKKSEEHPRTLRIWWSKRVGWDGLDMLNENMIMTGSNIGRFKELDRVRPKKTWWDCVKNNMENLGLSQKE